MLQMLSICIIYEGISLVNYKEVNCFGFFIRYFR